MKTKQPPKPFGLRDKLGYLLGDLGNDFTFLLSSSFLLKFYTDVMGVDAFAVGLIMMAARLADGFTDIAMGRLCDRGKTTPAGKFKPWLLRMCVPVAASSFLMYQSALAGAGTAFKTGWLLVTYLLWGSFFYTSVNIPYGSMASVISPDPGDRQSLSTFRTMGGTLAGVLVGAGVPLLAYTRDAAGNEVLDGGRFTFTAGIFSILAVLCYLLCYFLVVERVRVPREEHLQNRESVWEMLRGAFQNRALLSIIAASVMMLFSQLTLQSMANYVYPNFYGSAAAQSASTLVMMASMLLAAAAAKPLSKRFGKAEVSAVSSLLAAAVCFFLFFLRPADVWTYVAFIAVCWLGLGMFSMVTWALITDVIDDSELRKGIREDGSVYALYSFARKLGQAAAAGLSGSLLSLIGYSQESAFHPDVVNGIFNISTLAPGGGFLLLAAILWFWYPLRKNQVEKNTAALQALHEKRREPPAETRP